MRAGEPRPSAAAIELRRDRRAVRVQRALHLVFAEIIALRPDSRPWRKPRRGAAWRTKTSASRAFSMFQPNCSRPISLARGIPSAAGSTAPKVSSIMRSPRSAEAEPPRRRRPGAERPAANEYRAVEQRDRPAAAGALGGAAKDHVVSGPCKADGGDKTRDSGADDQHFARQRCGGGSRSIDTKPLFPLPERSVHHARNLGHIAIWRAGRLPSLSLLSEHACFLPTGAGSARSMRASGFAREGRRFGDGAAMSLANRSMPVRNAAGFLVHVLTASGGAVALLALYAAIRTRFSHHFRMAWARDGTLTLSTAPSRGRARVTETAATISGVGARSHHRLPRHRSWRADRRGSRRSDLMPTSVAFWIGLDSSPPSPRLAVLRRHAHEDRKINWFRGFPGPMERLRPLPLHVFRLPWIVNAAAMLIAAALMFAPAGNFVHPPAAGRCA